LPSQSGRGFLVRQQTVYVDLAANGVVVSLIVTVCVMLYIPAAGLKAGVVAV
jgi:hypothetical protein